MVHLKKINPFEGEVAYSISCFSDERSFYDCINRKFLEENAFQNLEYSFHTYLLTGDEDEWIGYVLFSNSDLVTSYFDFSYHESLNLLNDFRNTFMNTSNYSLFEKLEMLLTVEKHSTHISIILNEFITSLNSLEVFDVSIKEKMISSYQERLLEYLKRFPDYYYLDIVISLPLEEPFHLKKENPESSLNINLLGEKKYYGFIQEVLFRVEEEIQMNFSDIPILIRQDSHKIIFTNMEEVPENIPIVK